MPSLWIMNPATAEYYRLQVTLDPDMFLGQLHRCTIQ